MYRNKYDFSKFYLRKFFFFTLRGFTSHLIYFVAVRVTRLVAKPALQSGFGKSLLYGRMAFHKERWHFYKEGWDFGGV